MPKYCCEKTVTSRIDFEQILEKKKRQKRQKTSPFFKNTFDNKPSLIIHLHMFNFDK